MLADTHRHYPPLDHTRTLGGAGSAAELADALLVALVDSPADVLVLSPMANGVYLVDLEERLRATRRARIDAGLGSLVVARVALLAGIELATLGRGSHYGRMQAEVDGRTVHFHVRVHDHGSGPVLEAVEQSVGESRADLRLESGERIGPYEIVGDLGCGGTARILRVRHTLLGRDFAMKIARQQGEAEYDAMARMALASEARLASRIRHERVVQLTDCGKLPGSDDSYLVMELLDGPSLAEVMDEHGHLAPDYALSLVANIAEALDAAHQAGIVHSDLSPGNLHFSDPRDPDSIHVIDFGAATTVGEKSDDEYILATLAYMSPESLRGQAPGPESDIYSLGVILYEALCGELPYDADTALDMAVRQEQGPPEPIALPNKIVSAACNDIIARTMARCPEDRFSSGTELAEACREAREAQKGWTRWFKGNQ